MRIGMVALALLGGTGLIVYAAALVLVEADGEVGVGLLEVRHRDSARHGPSRPLETDDPDERNSACATRIATKTSVASQG